MTTQNTPIRRLIDRYETETALIFKPSKKFYQQTGINRIRFAQLTNGEKRPMLDEANELAKFFSRFFPTTTEDFHNSKQ